jgi:hypothetical protein
MEEHLNKDIVEDEEGVEGEDILDATDREEEMVDKAYTDAVSTKTHNNPLQHHQQ